MWGHFDPYYFRGCDPKRSLMHFHLYVKTNFKLLFDSTVLGHVGLELLRCLRGAYGWLKGCYSVPCNQVWKNTLDRDDGLIYLRGVTPCQAVPKFKTCGCLTEHQGLRKKSALLGEWAFMNFFSSKFQLLTLILSISHLQELPGSHMLHLVRFRFRTSGAQTW